MVDGIDGCGKSTQALRLVEWIFNQHKKIDTIVLTNEPTQSKFGLEIRKYLDSVSEGREILSKERLLELFTLDRENHVDEIIAPMLEKKAIVICDRYKHSSIVYQSTQGIPVQSIIQKYVGFPIPDITLIFNANIESCIARLDSRGRSLDKFEKKEFLEKAREQYVRLPTLLPKERIQIINANQSIEQVFQDVVKAVKPLLDEIIK